MLAQAQRAAAVAQREERVELLHELDRRAPAAQRADRHRAPRRGRGRDLEHGVGDVQAAAQVDVRVVVLHAHVARRAQLLDEPVLEHERAELGRRRAVVDHRRLRDPALATPSWAGSATARGCAGRPTCRCRAPGRRRCGRGRRPARRAARRRRRGAPRGPGARSCDPRADGAACAPRRCSSSSASPTVPACDDEPRQQRAQHARGASRRRPARGALTSTSMPSASASGSQPAPARERREAARERDRAQRRAASGHSSSARANAWRSTRRSNAMLCADEHPALELLGEVGQHELDRRRLVDHRLRDPGEALDHATERRADADERLPAVVQLAAADEHRAELGELALVARACRSSPCRRRGTRSTASGWASRSLIHTL